MFRDDLAAVITSDRLLLQDSVGTINAIHISESDKYLIKSDRFHENSKLVKKLVGFLAEFPRNLWVYKYKDTKFYKTALYFYMNGIKKDAIKVLMRKKVIIIGVGGIGTELIKHLVAVGINDIVVIDFDKVNIDNLNRQYIYKEKDVGKSKISVTKRLYNADIIGINKKIKNNDDFKQVLLQHGDADIVVNCADIPPVEINGHILSCLLSKNIAFCSGGIGLNKGIWGPLVFTRKEKSEELRNISLAMDNTEYISTCASSFGPTNSAISDFLAKDIIFYLLGEKRKVKSLNARVIFDFDTMGIKKIAN
jgi:hypothetical protein